MFAGIFAYYFVFLKILLGVYGCLNRVFAGIFLLKQLFNCVLFFIIWDFLLFERWFVDNFCRREQNIFKVIFLITYMFGWFFGKKEIEKIREDAKSGFDAVKKDINSVSGWIKHLDSEKNLQNKEIEDLKTFLSSIKEDLDGLKNVISIMNELKPKQVFKTTTRAFNKQMAVYPVQTGVQTGVQTPNLDQFSITERAILWILLNTDMKLSYDDLAAMLGKEKSTIRGQINTIKQKSESLIEEVIEKNGKKRVFIPEELKNKLLKKSKVRIKPKKGEKKRVSEY